MFLLLPHDWDNGGGHKPLNSAVAKCYECPLIPSARDRKRGWTVAEVQKTNNFLWPSIRTQKRPQFALTDKLQAFQMLTFSDWCWLRQLTRWVQQYTSIKKSGLYDIFLVLGKFSNQQIVCDAANLQRGVEGIHNLQNAVHYQIPRRFIQIKKPESA